MVEALTVPRFRWVACQIDNLKNCLDYRTLRQALETLPKTLDETYARILEGIPGAYSAHAATILNLLIWSDKTFGIRTLVDAIATDIDGSPAFDPKNRMPVPREVLKLCSSLVAVSQHVEYPDEDQVRLAHFSVKEYLVSNHVSRAFKSLIAEKAARSYLARLCLTYLMDVNQLILRGSSIGELDFDDICREFPFLRYSTLNWMDHARDVENEDERLYEMMLSFFSEGHKTFSLFGKLFDRFNRSVTFAGIVLDMREDLNHDPWHDPAHRRSPLFYAASGGLRRVVEYLLDTGAEINLDEGAALNAALDKGQETTARLLLDRGADVNLGRGRALIEAAHYGDDPIVQLLLDRGANTNARHGEALAIAVEYGRDTTVQVLLDRGADVNAGRGKALLRAIHVDHETAIQLLLDRGANVNVRNGKALIEAVHCGEATLHLLLDRGADINAKRGQALTRAIYYKDTIAQLLLDRGADVNAGNGEALLAAVVRDQEATVQLLLDKGANVNARAGQALRVAVEKGKDMMVQSLLKGGAHVYGTALLLTLDSFLHTNVPLHSLQDTTIQLLIDRGANPDMHRGSTLTALQDISKEAYGRLVRHLLQDDISRAKALELDWLKDYLRIARLLIDKGADTKLPGIDWLEILRTGDWSVQIVENILERSAFLSANHLLSAILDTNPQAEAIVSIMLSYLSLATAAKELDEETQWNMMHYAAICGSEIVTQRCLDLGVNVNAHDRDGRTALHHAAHFRHLVIVKMLVRAGSDPHTSDVNGERPLTCVADDHSDSYWLAIDKGWRGQTPRDDIIRYLRRCMFYRLLFVSQTKKSQVRFRSGRRSRKTTYRAYRRRGKSIGDNIRPAKKRAFRWMSSDSDSDNSSSSRRRSSDFSF
jgi:ankyrin repeat protein